MGVRPGFHAAATRVERLPAVQTQIFLVAASSAAAAAAATTAAAAASATASTVPSTAPGVLGFGAGFVYVERASPHLRPVQCSDGLFSIFVTGHFYKAEAA